MHIYIYMAFSFSFFFFHTIFDWFDLSLQTLVLKITDTIYWFSSYGFLCIFFLVFLYLTLKVVFVYDPIISLLYLILLITLICFYWVFLGLDFLGLIFLMVYVGAIAILFLFAIMMLNLHTYHLRVEKLPTSFFKIQYFFYFLLFFFFFFLLFSLCFDAYLSYSSFSHFFEYFINSSSKLRTYNLEYNHLRAIGVAFYSKYSYYLILSGLILFLGMAGPILLTFETKNQTFFTRYRHLNTQTYRTWLLNVRKKIVAYNFFQK